MKREYHKWSSPALGRDMELLVFGHAGLPVARLSHLLRTLLRV